jgi:hypothetical protein
MVTELKGDPPEYQGDEHEGYGQVKCGKEDGIDHGEGGE